MFVFDDNNVECDLILGRNAMVEKKIKLDFVSQEIEWFDEKASFHTRDWYCDNNEMQKVLEKPPLSVTKANLEQIFDTKLNDTKCKVADLWAFMMDLIKSRNELGHVPTHPVGLCSPSFGLTDGPSSCSTSNGLRALEDLVTLVQSLEKATKTVTTKTAK